MIPSTEFAHKELKILISSRAQTGISKNTKKQKQKNKTKKKSTTTTKKKQVSLKAML